MAKNNSKVIKEPIKCKICTFDLDIKRKHPASKIP